MEAKLSNDFLRSVGCALSQMEATASATMRTGRNRGRELSRRGISRRIQ